MRRPTSCDRSRRVWVGVALVAAALWLGVPSLSLAHDASVPIHGTKLVVKSDKFIFEAKDERAVRLSHDPMEDSTSVFVQGLGKKGGTSGLIRLDQRNWAELRGEDGSIEGYKYRDESGLRGGITRVVLKQGMLKVKAKGERWPYTPKSKLKSLWLQFRMDDELYCAELGPNAGSRVSKNEKGVFKAKGGEIPGSCPGQVCGNGFVELGEYCDDGNLSETDGCNNDCTLGICTDEEFASTFDALQSVIFDSEVYQCTNDACHGSAQEGKLDLRAGNAFGNLVGIDSDFGTQKRVLQNEPALSLLYNKLAKKTVGAPEDVGTAMPVTAPALSEQHLKALYEWIRGGASRDASVMGTSTLLASCLPASDPLIVDPPDPPAPGVGVQLNMDPRPLPAQSESEVCMSTYFDFSAVIPEWAKVECPEELQRRGVCSNAITGPECSSDAECTDDASCLFANNLNTGNECFAYDRLNLVQDAQSHHTVGFVYSGIFDTSDPGWGQWTQKFRDGADPRDGEPCDPTEIDPALGYNPNCSGAPIDSPLCISYGPPDYSDPTNLIGGAQLFFTTEAYLDVNYVDSVYAVFPVKGVLAWNSHAFNLTGFDSTMASYMNLEFAREEDQQNPVRLLAGLESFFTQNVPAFETREYCDSHTLEKGSRLFRLFSHTHRTGVLFRAWAPPNEPCRGDCDSFFCFGDESLPLCTGPREDTPTYLTTSYSDPLQLGFDPPVAYDQDDDADRTWLYCAVYDNGSTPTSPRVKRQSTSPPSPAGPDLGGPCFDNAVVCANEGPMKGELCRGDDSVCDSESGAGDGDCDACPVKGGLTAEDEMMILFGNFYCDGSCEGDEPVAGEGAEPAAEE